MWSEDDPATIRTEGQMAIKKHTETASNPGLFVVRRGEIVTHLMGDLTMLCRELDQRRTFDADIGAWFERHPDLSERFGAFQEMRATERATPMAALQKVAAAVNAKRRSRR